MDTILLNSDGTFPVELSGNVHFFGGRLRHSQQKSASIRGGSALPNSCKIFNYLTHLSLNQKEKEFKSSQIMVLLKNLLNS